jgi:hypothetical protein
MLIQSLLTMKGRHALVRDAYRKSMQSYREFTNLWEQRAIEVSPDQKPVLLNCFRLQNLLMDQRAIRFEYLLKSKSLDCAIFESLDEIAERLDKDWNATEEGALKECNSHYSDLSREIYDIQSKWAPDALAAPLKAVEQDPEYRAAREAIANRVQELRSRIAPS